MRLRMVLAGADTPAPAVSSRICVTAETPVQGLGGRFLFDYRMRRLRHTAGSLSSTRNARASAKKRERGTEQADLDADRLSRTVTSEADLIYKTLLSWLLLSQNQCLRP